MPADNAQESADTFSITLAGRVVECVSLEDAVAVKTAEDILSGQDSTPYQPATLERLAEVLVRYHRLDAAEALRSDGHCSPQRRANTTVESIAATQ